MFLILFINCVNAILLCGPYERLEDYSEWSLFPLETCIRFIQFTEIVLFYSIFDFKLRIRVVYL